MKKVLISLILFVNFIIASDKIFILNHAGLIDQRAYDKINEIGLEVRAKLNIDIFLDVKGNNGIDLNLPMIEKMKLMKEKNNLLIANTKKISSKNFIILAISLDQEYAGILYSNEKLKDIVNRNDVLDGYVTPLLASFDKNILKSKVSAASLNGYAQIADLLADNKNIKLESSIGSQGKTASTIWRVFIYTTVLFGIIAYTIIIMREKKAKRKNNGNE